MSTVTTNALEYALGQLDPDVAVTPRMMLAALHQAAAMSTLGYPVHGVEARTTNVPGTPRDPRDRRYPDMWLNDLSEHIAAFAKAHAHDLNSIESIEALRYALDKTGLTLVLR